MTHCILSPLLGVVVDISIYIVFPVQKEEKILQSLRDKKLQEPLFLFETSNAFDMSQSRFNNHTVSNYGAGQTHNIKIN